MEIFEILIFGVTGAIAGLLSGLLGIGGGIIYVPVIMGIMENRGFLPQNIPMIAVSTSLLIMMTAMLNGVQLNWKRGNILFRELAFLSFGGLIGAWLASLLLKGISAEHFKVIFAVFLIVMGLQLLRGGKNTPSERTSISFFQMPLGFATVGGLAGFISSFFGVGGGIIVVPALYLLGGFGITRSIGTSSGFIVIIAAASLVFHGLHIDYDLSQNQPTIGNIYPIAFLLIAPIAFLLNRVGAKRAQKMDSQRLRKVFASVVMMIGAVKLAQWGL